MYSQNASFRRVREYILLQEVKINNYCSRKIFPNMNLTSGPAAKSCQKKAIGKFLTVSSQKVANICVLNPPLKRIVAIKLIIGHINHIEKIDIARMIAIGLSFPGVTILKAHFLASGPAMKVSSIKPATIMIGYSSKAALNTKFFIPPVSIAIL